MQALQFLKALYGNKPQSQYILIWQKDGKRSNWFQRVEDAASFCANKPNAYVGVGLSPQNFGAKKRCVMDKISAIAGHFIDMDFAGPWHKKAKLPADMDAAMQIIAKFAMKPSIVVHSGHGLQAWWLFHDIWILKNETERKQARLDCLRFNYTFKHLAGGLEIDSTFDIARVLRIPGTINSKPELNLPDVKAEIIEVNDVRYNPEDVRNNLINIDAIPERALNKLDIEIVEKGSGQQQLEINAGFHQVASCVGPQSGSAGSARSSRQATATRPTGTKATGNVKAPKASSAINFVLKAGAEPPKHKLDALIDLEPMFKAAWEKKRKDLPSASEYDLSIASFAAGVEWSDQEIADMIIAWRRMHNQQPEKALRKDYMQDTIAAAKKKAVSQKEIKAAEKVITSALPPKQGNGQSFPKNIRDSAKATVLQYLNIDIEKIMAFSGENPTYQIVTKSFGEKKLPNIKNLIDQKLLRERIAEFANYYIPHYKIDKWIVIANALLKLIETVDMGEEATDKGLIKSWVERYLEGRNEMDLKEAAQEYHPFVHTNGRWHIFVEQFVQWAQTRYGYKGNSRLASVEFKALGFAQYKHRPVIKGTRCMRRTWEVPPNIGPTPQNINDVADLNHDGNDDEQSSSGGKILNFKKEFKKG